MEKAPFGAFFYVTMVFVVLSSSYHTEITEVQIELVYYFRKIGIECSLFVPYDIERKWMLRYDGLPQWYYQLHDVKIPVVVEGQKKTFENDVFVVSDPNRIFKCVSKRILFYIQNEKLTVDNAFYSSITLGDNVMLPGVRVDLFESGTKNNNCCGNDDIPKGSIDDISFLYGVTHCFVDNGTPGFCSKIVKAWASGCLVLIRDKIYDTFVKQQENVLLFGPEIQSIIENKDKYSDIIENGIEKSKFFVWDSRICYFAEMVKKWLV